MNNEREDQAIASADVGSMAAVLQGSGEPVTSEGVVASGATADGSVSGTDSEGGEPDAPAEAKRVPIVGMAMEFWASDGTGPWPARVDHVWGDECVNVHALVDGRVGVYTSVLVRREGDEQPGGYYVRFIDSDSGMPTLEDMRAALRVQREIEDAIIAEALAKKAVPVISVHHLHIAQGLPEVGADEPEVECVFAPDTIQAFKSTDGRSMRIVHLGERGLAAKAVTR